MEQVSTGASGPGWAWGRGEGVPVRRTGGWARAASRPSRTCRRRAFTALAGSINPSSSSTRVSRGRNTVPPVFSSRDCNSSAVRARFRASSGVGPSARTTCPPALAVRDTGSPARRVQTMSTGTRRLSSLLYPALARANSSLDSGAFSGRVPNISGPVRPL